MRPFVVSAVIGVSIGIGTWVWSSAQLAAQAKPLPGVDYPRVNLSAGYRVDEKWPADSPTHAWAAMAGIAIDEQGLIWTLNRGKMPVQVFDAQGKLVRQWGEGRFGSPHQMRFGPRGHLWIVDSQNHVVQKFTPAGELLLTLGISGEPGDDQRHFKMPTDVVETSTGDIFVSDGYRNNRVVHFNGKGEFVKTWGSLGTAPGQFSLPHAIALDSRGRIFVADRNNARVQIFGQDGKFLAEWRNRCVPWTVRITAKDEVYLCGSSPSQWRPEDVQLGIPPKDQVVVKLDSDGNVDHWWVFPSGTDSASKPGQLAWVHGMAVDSSGNLYLGDIMGKRAQRFQLQR